MPYILMYLTVIILTAFSNMLQQAVVRHSEQGNVDIAQAILPAMWLVTASTVIMYLVAGLFTIRLIRKNF